jgi:hypothetical protein
MRDLRLQNAPKSWRREPRRNRREIDLNSSVRELLKSQFPRLHVFPGFRERRQHWLVGLRAMSLETQEIST